MSQWYCPLYSFAGIKFTFFLIDFIPGCLRFTYTCDYVDQTPRAIVYKFRENRLFIRFANVFRIRRCLQIRLHIQTMCTSSYFEPFKFIITCGETKKNASPLNTKYVLLCLLLLIDTTAQCICCLERVHANCIKWCTDFVCAVQLQSSTEEPKRRWIVWARYAYEMYVYILCELGLIKPHTFNVCVIFTHSLHRAPLYRIAVAKYMWICCCIIRRSFGDSKVCTPLNVHLHLAAIATMQ